MTQACEPYALAAAVDLLQFPVPETGAPPPIQLLKWGINQPVDIGMMTRQPFVVDQPFLDQLLANFALRTKELVIDYNHASLGGFQDAPAAGWMTALEAVAPEAATDQRPAGLWIVPSWTPEGRRRVREGEYRYLSAVLAVDWDTGVVLPMLINAAVTNMPAIHGLAAIAASAQRTSAEIGAGKEGTMPDLQELLKKLGFPSVEALETALGELKTKAAQVEPLTAKLTEATTKVEAFSTENAGLRVERALALAKAAGKGSEPELAFVRRIAGDEQAFSAWLAIPTPQPAAGNAPQPPTAPLNPAPPAGATALAAAGADVDPERAALAAEVQAYAGQHKCPWSEAYEAVTAARKAR